MHIDASATFPSFQVLKNTRSQQPSAPDSMTQVHLRTCWQSSYILSVVTAYFIQDSNKLSAPSMVIQHLYPCSKFHAKGPQGVAMVASLRCSISKVLAEFQDVRDAICRLNFYPIPSKTLNHCQEAFLAHPFTLLLICFKHLIGTPQQSYTQPAFLVQVILRGLLCWVWLRRLSGSS